MSVRQSLNLRLFLVSVVMLFSEITLIRWISTEARIFAYVNNLVLLSCFLGIGLGCYLSRKKINIWISAAALSLIILMIELPIVVNIDGGDLHLFKDVPLLLSAFTDSIIWYEPLTTSSLLTTLVGMASTLMIFCVIMITFIPMGQYLGRSIDEHMNTITAYSINVAASVVGIWCFSGFSFLYTPPFAWFAFIAAMLLALVFCSSIRSKVDLASVLLLFLIVIWFLPVSSHSPGTEVTLWSPYQKLEVRPLRDRNLRASGGYSISVNNVGYMSLLNLSEGATESGSVRSGLSQKKFSQYDIPYLLAGNAQKVLILGAGGGNDAAGALRHDVRQIDAVEIDPGIYKLGTSFHPERPYSDSRVNVIVEDARSFLKKSTEKYDVISFGLLDAHTLVSSYNNIRIDHYVYTKQAFEEARELLREDGILTVIFEAQRTWIAQRLHCLLEEVFGEAPVAFKIRRGRLGWGGTMFVVGARRGAAEEAIKSDPALASFVFQNRVDYLRRDSTAAPVRLTTDDWPYLYLEEAAIPSLHLSIMVILLLILVAASKMLPSKGQKLNFHFFFLGAAFLLLEFQNVSKSTMLFGSTWQVNSFIISAILILILLANLFVSRFKPENMKTIYILLLLSLLVSYFIPLSLFNVLGYWPKSIAASVVLNLPIFFAGVIFIDSFRKTRHKDLAFGSNLLGAAAGGLMESLSFIVGINMLLLVALGFYGLSWMFLNRSD